MSLRVSIDGQRCALATELETLERLLERFSMALIASGADADGLCLRCSAYFDDGCPVRHLHDGCPYQNMRAETFGQPAPPET